MLRLEFEVDFSTTNGIWQTDRIVPIDKWTGVEVVYNSSAVGNNPIVYLREDDGGVITTLTVGDGLTETQTPVGTRVSAAGDNMYVGGGTAVDGYDGMMDHYFVFDDTRTPAEVAIDLAAPLTNVGEAGLQAYFDFDDMGASGLLLTENKATNPSSPTDLVVVGAESGAISGNTIEGNAGALIKRTG